MITRRNLMGMMGPLAVGAEQKRIRVGFLGTGHSHFAGKFEAVRNSGRYEVAGIARAGEEVKGDGKYAGVRWLSEEAMLGDAGIDLVVVECRVWEAIEWGRKVIMAGKHLHVEKPVGNDWAAFRELVEEARRRRLLLQTGYVWRWHEGILAALEAARKGWLGEVLMVRGTMNADRSAAERAVEARYRGGGMFELSGHVIDRMVELLGRPKTVKSWLRHDTGVKDGLADNNVAVLEFDRALGIVTQTAKMAGATDHRSFEVIGTDGTVIVHPEAAPPRLRVHARQARGPYQAGWQEKTLGPQPRFVGDFAEMARAIGSGTALGLSYDHELLLQETLLRVSGELA
ncbi:MAG: Gfo/Idh/MocA family oxidoreductase [Bryobacter sp.]|jgi:predicted dehydrogenase|nr:Gfo/Idh/MocA family oxidoreductase [Bryobacter sp. CoA8 C33]